MMESIVYHVGAITIALYFAQLTLAAVELIEKER